MKEKLKSILKARFFYYLLFIVISFVVYFYNFIYKLHGIYHSNTAIYLFVAFAIIISIILIIMINILKKTKQKNYHFFYGLCAFVLGIIYIILAPVFTGSDEHNHLYRIYEITDGKVVTSINNGIVGGDMPESLLMSFSTDINSLQNTNIKYYDEIDKMQIALNKKDTIEYGHVNASSYQNTALYSPLQYIPHVIGVSIGKVFNFGPFLLIILGRLFNLIFFVGITMLGLKILPERKLFASAVLLSPVVMSGATTLSSDGFTYALIFLFVAYVLNFIKTKKKISVGNRIILSLLAIFISVCKIVYLPLLLLLFLIPDICYKNKKEKWIFNIILFILGIFISLLWMHLVQGIFDSYYVNAELQKRFVFTNLFEYIFILIRTYMYEFTMLINNLFFGSQLYHGQLNVYSFLSLAYFILVFLIFINEKSTINISKNSKIIVIFIILLVAGLIPSALYLQHTATWYEIGKEVVTGMQGRYYIPILFLLLFLIGSNKLNKIDEKLFFNCIILLQFTCFLTMLVQFV